MERSNVARQKHKLKVKGRKVILTPRTLLSNASPSEPLGVSDPALLWQEHQDIEGMLVVY